MDAKPQRPFRTFKIRDENIPPSIFPSKAIHQRNKSSPALSALVQGNGIKVSTKRAVFADVSNTARTLQGIRDDSAILNKPSYKDTKEPAVQDNTQSAALSRPAQRPLSVSGLRGFFNNLTSSSSSVAVKPAAPEQPVDQQANAANIRKPLARRATTVFREPDPPLPPPELFPVEELKPIELPPLPFTLLDGFEDIPNTVTAENEQIAAPTQPEPLIQEEWQDAISYADDIPDVRSDRVEKHNRQSIEYLGAESVPSFDPAQIYEDASAIQQPVVPVSQPDTLVSQPPRRKSSVKTNDRERSVQPPTIPETEEYWENATYDEPYEDESYTTARSIRSRGDYTTGATTVVLAPKMTAQAEREIATAKILVDQSRDAEDIEADEAWDTSMVAEYGDEIFEYMRKLEEQMRPNAHYMDNQTEVQWSMRSVLMDWLVQVHHRFNLLPETLFLCVNYIDRFLSAKVVSLGKLQLVGATAIFIAAKYEEINCPSIQEIVYMVDGGYTVDEILKAERFMLTMLQFELGWPGPMSFLRRISKADDYDLETRTLAKYFLELTIMDERFVACIPSYTAAGAHCLARLMLRKSNWTPAHVVYSNYTYSQLRPLLQTMLSCCEDPQKHHSAIYDKYGDKRFKRASYFVQSEVSSGFVLPASNCLAPSLSNIPYEWRINDY